MLVIALCMCLPPLALGLIIVLAQVERALLSPPSPVVGGALIPIPRTETAASAPLAVPPPAPIPLQAAS